MFDYLTAKARICLERDEFDNCDGCPFSYNATRLNIGCNEFIVAFPNQAKQMIKAYFDAKEATECAD